jgi:hypothetical protein
MQRSIQKVWKPIPQQTTPRCQQLGSKARAREAVELGSWKILMMGPWACLGVTEK